VIALRQAPLPKGALRTSPVYTSVCSAIGLDDRRLAVRADVCAFVGREKADVMTRRRGGRFATPKRKFTKEPNVSADRLTGQQSVRNVTSSLPSKAAMASTFLTGLKRP